MPRDHLTTSQRSQRNLRRERRKADAAARITRDRKNAALPVQCMDAVLPVDATDLFRLQLPSSPTAEASLPSRMPTDVLLAEPVFERFHQVECLHTRQTHQSHAITPSSWDEAQVHGWLADKPYRTFLEGTLWETNESATRTPVMLSQVGEPWTKWNGGLLALAFAHPTTFLQWLGENAVKFFCDMETLFISEVHGYGRDVLRARRDDREHPNGSMRTWTVRQVQSVIDKKLYKHKLHDLQWNGMHLYAALRFPGAFLPFMGTDGVVFWRDLEMLANGPPAEEAWCAGR
jgi:hypothetical protein